MDKPKIFDVQLENSIIFPFIKVKNRQSDAKRIYKKDNNGSIDWSNNDDVYGGYKIEIETGKRLIRIFEDGNIEMYDVKN